MRSCEIIWYHAKSHDIIYFYLSEYTVYYQNCQNI